ncbi:MAG: PP2C family serine/threonine-protein phosphatase [Spirochaetota bacterium]
MKVLVSGASDIGQKRSQNEDAYSIVNLGSFSTHDILQPQVVENGISLLVVDGMGGSFGGALAAGTIVTEVRAYLRDNQKQTPEELLPAALQSANLACRKIMKEQPKYRRMGAVATIAHILDSQLYICHIGDTRLYLLREGKFSCVTEDQTMVHELLKSGAINEEEAANHKQKNVVSQAIGPLEEPKPYNYQKSLQQGDRILICSDGLHGLLSEEEMCELANANSSLKEIVLDLIAAANARGGDDNITAIVMEVVET